MGVGETEPLIRTKDEHKTIDIDSNHRTNNRSNNQANKHSTKQSNKRPKDQSNKHSDADYYQSSYQSRSDYAYHDITLPESTNPNQSVNQSVSQSINQTINPSSLASKIWRFLSWIFSLVCIAAFATAVYLAFRYHHEKCEYPLPIVMGVVGVCGLVWWIVVPWQVALEERASPAWSSACCRLTWLIRIILLFTSMTSTTIASLWTFVDMKRSSDYQCPEILFEFSYWFLIVWWCCVGVTSLVIAVVGTIMAMAFMK